MPDTSRFELDTQEQHNWCWASVSAGVHGFVNTDAAHRLRQCEVAQLLLGGDPCSNAHDFDLPQRLDTPMQAALRQLGWHVTLVPNALSFAELEAEINAGRPVCTHISWSGNRGAHFNVIYGYRVTQSGRKQLHVSDPFFVDSTVDYDFFVSSYQDEGTWDRSILISRPAK